MLFNMKISTISEINITSSRVGMGREIAKKVKKEKKKHALYTSWKRNESVIGFFFIWLVSTIKIVLCAQRKHFVAGPYANPQTHRLPQHIRNKVDCECGITKTMLRIWVKKILKPIVSFSSNNRIYVQMARFFFRISLGSYLSPYTAAAPK